MSIKQVSNKATLDAGKVSYLTMNDRKEPSLSARTGRNEEATY